ncbi:MAG: (d)CMP kinase [Magnetococcales bacterium]|nr:(d)CMP kinase [Magnetococcales bacterium]
MSAVRIAVDGPAGAGKGAVCRAVAQRFQMPYLDTGSIYRAVGLLSIRSGQLDPEKLARAAQVMDYLFKDMGDGSFGAFLGGENVTTELRQEATGERASQVAAMPQVREALLAFQRTYGAGGHRILDGRDVGTVVWPDADLKIFLTASLEERANRRALELQAKGEAVSVQQICDRMAERDARDSGRDHAPMISAADAVVVDTTHLTLEESIEQVVRLVEPLVGG